MTLQYFAACAPGLERWLATELTQLGCAEVSSEPGGVNVRGGPEVMATVCMGSGLANHLRLRIGEPFEVKRFDKLVRRVTALPWSDVLPSSAQVAVKAVCKKSRLYHSDAVAQRVVKGIAKAVGPAISSGPKFEVTVRIVRDLCVVSLDVSGDALHRRGWRQQTAKAPLREDLARALLLASGWRPGRRLIDPLMGAGTILIEAATMAARMAPGRLRRFAFEHSKLGRATRIADARARFKARELPLPPGMFAGLDKNAGALTATQGNAERAGVLDALELGTASLEPADWAGPRSTMVIANPPYGLRVGDADSLQGLYRRLGEGIGNHGWDAGIVIADRRFLRALDLPLQPRLITDHGGIKVEFFSTAKR